MAKGIQRVNYYDLKQSVNDDKQVSAAVQSQFAQTAQTIAKLSRPQFAPISGTVNESTEMQSLAAESETGDNALNNVESASAEAETDISDTTSNDSDNVTEDNTTDDISSNEAESEMNNDISDEHIDTNDSVDPADEFIASVANMYSTGDITINVVNPEPIESVSQPTDAVVHESSDHSSDEQSASFTDNTPSQVNVVEPPIDHTDADSYQSRYDDDDTETEADNGTSEQQTTVSAVRQNLLPEDVEGTVSIKNFPKAIVNKLRNMFPTATNQYDPIIAYIYLKEGEPPDMPVSNAVKALAANYSGDKVTARDIQLSVDKNLRNVDNRLRDILRITQAIELGVVYDICQNADLLRYDIDDPGTVEFLQKAVIDVFSRLERQSKSKIERDKDREGRDVYQAKYNK